MAFKVADLPLSISIVEPDIVPPVCAMATVSSGPEAVTAFESLTMWVVGEALSQVAVTSTL